MSELPRPVTTDQEYHAAILRELRGISAKLDARSSEPQPVSLAEPAAAPRRPSRKKA
jgi:hypothetical protein